MADRIETGVIYRDDNLDRVARMPSESVDLIYLDPPFFSNRQYEVIWGDEAEVRSFEDRWQGGIQVYVAWMRERLLELHRVLKPTGSLYLHCDPTASHYLKAMLDGVFGRENFRSDIRWQRTNTHSDSKGWSAVSDDILYYVKNTAAGYTWNPLRGKHSAEYLATKYRYREPNGRVYRLDNMTSPNPRPNMMYEWKGHASPAMGWRYEKATMERLDNEGRIWYPDVKRKRPQLKRYLDEMPGVLFGDVWTDIPPINSQAREREGYPTQKPLPLLKRILAASSNVGDVVLDPFCGCGTTLAAAEELERSWIGIDISPTACRVMERRLQRMGATPRLENMPLSKQALKGLKPFEFQNFIIDKMLGVHAPRQTGDMGIDGYSWFEHLPIQVKQSERVGRNTVDNFETAIDRSDRTAGYIVAFSFTRGANEEVARVKKARGIDIRLVRVSELFREETPAPVDYSPVPGLSALPSAAELVASERTGIGELMARLDQSVEAARERRKRPATRQQAG